MTRNLLIDKLIYSYTHFHNNDNPNGGKTLYTQISTEPIPGGRKVVNNGLGNKCDFCGHSFDSGGTCNNGHEQGRTYYLPALKTNHEQPTESKSQDSIMIMCQVVDQNRCSICNGIMSDQYICVIGHQVGLSYLK